MRNVRARKLRPRKAHKALRRMNAKPEIINDSEVNSIALNMKKHLVLNKPYIYPEYQREMIRYAQRSLKKQKEQLDKESEKKDNEVNQKKEADNA